MQIIYYEIISFLIISFAFISFLNISKFKPLLLQRLLHNEIFEQNNYFLHLFNFLFQKKKCQLNIKFLIPITAFISMIYSLFDYIIFFLDLVLCFH